MKILIVDTLYNDFIRSLPFDPASTYEVELRKVLDRQFGTSDFFSRNLDALGHECMDVIANHDALQELWAKEHLGWYAGDRLESQMHDFSPDVVFMQDLSLTLPYCKGGALPKGMEPPLLAGQLSCPWPGDDKVAQYDVLMTSFPHYVSRIEALGVKAVFLPLAFEPTMLNRTIPRDRIHDIVFIGGVGNPSHWRKGMQTLELVAKVVHGFKWWGYGLETLPVNSPLRDRYQGQAWGREMYDILLQSKICLNRHGEVAEGFANNMRLFESTGCGSMLLTERASNLSDYFTSDECLTYDSPEEAVSKINYCLANSDVRESIAAAGQARTLRDHTYAKRMKAVSDTLTTMLAEREVNA